MDIRRWDGYDPDLLRMMAPGYESSERYTVKRVETSDSISFKLTLERLPSPYVAIWGYSGEEYDRYHSVVRLGHSLIATEGSAKVGLAIAEPLEWHRTLSVCEIHVAEEARGRGIGRLLVQKLVDIAHEQGLRAIVCETQNTNVPAIQFYRAVGFELDGIDLSYYTNTDADDFEVALFMKKKLPAAVSG